MKKEEEDLCNRSPKIKTKNIKNYSSILAIANHRNWLDDSPPLTSNTKYKGLSNNFNWQPWRFNAVTSIGGVLEDVLGLEDTF